MPVLSVSYDLFKEPSRAYEELFAAIEVFPWCRPTESTYYVETTKSPKELYEHLKPYLHAKDKIIISPVRPGSWWSQGLPKAVLDWLRAKLDKTSGLRRKS
jgi:hypothetical protein